MENNEPVEAEVDDAFQRVADTINDLVQKTIQLNFPMLLAAEGKGETDDVGSLCIAVLAGTLSAAGAIAAGWEPALDVGELAEKVLVEQFMQGRADYHAFMASQAATQ